MTSNFAEALQSGRFLVTSEEPPPKGPDLSEFVRRNEQLVGYVDAVSLTESSSAVMTMSPIGAVPALHRQGIEPILQITCRDRNRIALQADLLAAAALGVTTISCMAGDPIDAGDHPEAKGVFDLDTPALLRAVGGLNVGHDLAGRALRGSPSFCCGAMVNPSAPDLDREVAWMEQKAEAGARFFQTQAVYDPAAFERFMAKAQRLGLPVLAGFIVPKSAAMARRLNATLPGVSIPEAFIAELESAVDRRQTAIEISGRILSQLRGACRGVHIIAVGWESSVPEILERAGVTRD